MKKLVRMGMVVLIVFVVAMISQAFAVDAPPERAEAVASLKTYFAYSWPTLLGWVIAEVMPFLPTKSNGLVQLVVMWLQSKKTAGRSNILMLLCILGIVCSLLAAGCTTLNVSLNTSAGDNNKPAIKTDAQADQVISPQTTATIPLK